jgi:hypothetical protein
MTSTAHRAPRCPQLPYAVMATGSAERKQREAARVSDESNGQHRISLTARFVAVERRSEGLSRRADQHQNLAKVGVSSDRL